MKKKIIACVYIVMFMVALKLAFTYMYNEYVVNEYEDKNYDINMKPNFSCNYIQPHIAHYNAGNIHYQNQEYKLAIEEYKLAISKESKKNHMCEIRVNMALAIIKTLPEDYASEENKENTITKLIEARSILVEDECALETEAGHDGEATRLKEEIDNILKSLQNNNAQSGGNNNEPQGNQGNPETKREQEIKNKLKQQQNDGYNERYYNKEFYEDYFGGSYSVGDGPVW